MDFKKLYSQLASIAKSRNEKFPFVEGNPKVMGGYGKPDPDWALMAVHAGVKEGVISQQQADTLRKHYEPFARFEHRDGEVHVRAYTREGKQVAAHTRGAPEGKAPTGGTPPLVPERPMSHPFPEKDVLQPESPYKVEPHYAVNNMAEEGVQVAQNMRHVIDAVIDNTSEQLNALDDARAKMGSHLDGANIEAADTLRAYHPMVQKEILQSLRDEGSNDVLPTFQFSDDAGLPIGRATGLPLVKRSDYDKLKKIMTREGITPLDKARHPNKR